MKIPTALIGCRVDQTAFDFQVRLYLSALDPDEGYRVDAELVIETPFLFGDASGEWHELDPGTHLAPVLGLFGRTVTTVEVKGRGALELTFDDNAVLHIGPNQRYKSWHLTGTGVEPAMVGPGGETNWHLP